MRRFALLRLCLLLLVSAAMFAFTRTAQHYALLKAALAESHYQARAAACLDEMYAKHGWQPACLHGHWLSTRGRRLVTDQGRRWRGVGCDYDGATEPLRGSTFIRLSATPYFGEQAATEPARMTALAALVDRLSDDGERYVLVGLPSTLSPWLWRAQMDSVVHALGDRPYVMFDVSVAATAPAFEDAEVDLPLAAGERIATVRRSEQDAQAPAHVIAIDTAGIDVGDHGHHTGELDYAPLDEARLPHDNVVTLSRRPAYALRHANALFVEPLRARAPSVRPAS